MGLFDRAAGADARHAGSNPRDKYFDHTTDHGECVVSLVECPLKKTKGGSNIVPVKLKVVIAEADPNCAGHTLKTGDIRSFFVDLSDGSPKGLIRLQEFKALITALAGVPLADERVTEAIERLEFLTGKDHGLKDIAKAPVAQLAGARDGLITTLMEQWTDGEGTKGTGSLAGVAIYPRVAKNDPSKVFTNLKFEAVPAENVEQLREAGLI